MKTLDASLSDLQPTQMYICSEKLAAVERALNKSATSEIDPVPVKRLGGKVVLTDGHTRAFAAFRQDRRSLPVYWETDELDWDAYQVCVDWCLREGIRTIGHLQSRIVSTDQYETLWLQRCRRMHEQLALKRKAQTAQPAPARYRRWRAET